MRPGRRARDAIQAISDKHIVGAVCAIPWNGCDPPLGDERRQCGLDGVPAATLDELYAVAAKAKDAYAEAMTAACPSGAVLKLAPLKGRARAAAKAKNEYAKRAAPATSWLFDVVRGNVICDTEAELVGLIRALDADEGVKIVRLKNRFSPPEFNGYRDMLLNVAVRVAVDDREIWHLCELQVHHVRASRADVRLF